MAWFDSDAGLRPIEADRRRPRLGPVGGEPLNAQLQETPPTETACEAVCELPSLNSAVSETV